MGLSYEAQSGEEAHSSSLWYREGQDPLCGIPKQCHCDWKDTGQMQRERRYLPPTQNSWPFPQTGPCSPPVHLLERWESVPPHHEGPYGMGGIYSLI